MDAEIRTKFWKALADSPFVMVRADQPGATSEPLTAMLDRDAHHAIWFFVRTHNRAAAGGPAHVDFASDGHKVFAALTGTLTVERSLEVLNKLWSDKVQAWFPEGPSDPSILLLRYDITQAEVWIADLTLTGLFHLFTGTAIQPDQAGQHAVGLV